MEREGDMNCRAGAATISWTILGVPLICTFARLRLRLPFAVDFRRFPTNDCPFFLLGLSWSWVCQEEEETVDIVAFAFIISGVPRVFVVLNLPLSVSLSRSLFVLLREFITFRVLRLLSGVLLLSSHCPSLLSSALLCFLLSRSSRLFLLSFFVAVHLIFKRNLLLPSATVSPSPSSCPLCLLLLPLPPLAQPCCGQFRK